MKLKRKNSIEISKIKANVIPHEYSNNKKKIRLLGAKKKNIKHQPEKMQIEMKILI
mgnify:CR=1 FL=1